MPYVSSSLLEKTVNKQVKKIKFYIKVIMETILRQRIKGVTKVVL